MEDVRVLLSEKASDVYESLTFNDADDLYNKPAPEPFVTFILGAAFSLLGLVLWVIRLRKSRQAIPPGSWTTKLALRAMISAAIDNDSPVYTVVKITAQSFLFLAGIQLNYGISFAVMLGFFAFESSLDAFRTLLSVMEYRDFDHLVVTSNSMRTQIKKTSTVLKPSSVYEDLSRDSYIVIMVFITQGLLISFVVVDIFDSDVHSCPDGTGGCPVGGTLGSWCFYVLGIFMSLVFLLGPRTSFGQSEQNPAYWMQLLLFMKATGSKVSWHDPTTETDKSRSLSAGDWRVWTRFLMSFIINGVGFHILVHALPIQVAAQSSLTGVVFRAVGMLYLVDLDDTPGYTLTFTDEDDSTYIGNGKVAKEDTGNAGTDSDEDNAAVLTDEIDKILQEAHAKIDALKSSGSVGSIKSGGLVRLSGGMALAAAGGVAGASALKKQQQQQKHQDQKDMDDGEEGALPDTGGDA